MVLQVLSDIGIVLHHVEAVTAQVCARPDARKHQELGRVHRTAREDDLAPGLHGDVLALCLY